MTLIRFAPLSMPFPRRLQTLAVLTVSILGGLGPLLGTATFLVMLFTPLSIISILYVGVLFLWDFDKPSRGGRCFTLMRRLPIWKYFCDYFPITLIKTQDLKTNENYIFGYHPHGVISSGALGSFATEGAHFSKLFPGITPHLLTLKFNFRWPFHRDYLMSLGLCDVSKESITYICTKKGAGNAAVVVIGGAAESLEAYPGAATLTLKNRKGFVKMALKTGAHLVPVYAFGENDLLNQAKYPMLRKFQEMFRKWSGIAPVMFYGRGIFQYSFGLMPFRVPVSIVVGAPIKVKKSTNPSQEEIDSLHAEYIDELTNLYNENKKIYSQNPEVELKII
ncbi:2-acylglycerol O-acyltransferase 2-A-like isoform X2 [Hydractinia symbiolongicarpus]|uniref:2-acylglycerol O-acyltransferase 2-A-like isoform X2 n=1 Tax=Hydractinia symbiolongicarpus TaxID=13093 RepID=UPI00254FE5D6|nr:2-acylglycerol O-acyltransferase 2-A-like isoform X2 [Hydractinia symbiolongicarpus]